MYSVTKSFGLNGLRGFAVAVEADVSGGLPAFSIVGLLSVGKSQNLQSKRCQKCGTLRIIGHPLRLIVLRTIQFNNQLGRSTIKVCDKSPDDSLFINLHRIFAEEKIP